MADRRTADQEGNDVVGTVGVSGSPAKDDVLLATRVSARSPVN
jgi:hypothetical protein